MKRRVGHLLALLLFALGAWQIGEGAWIHAKAALAQVLIKRAWASGQPTHPWPWADTVPVARLSVPALGVDEIVLAGDSGRTLAFGPGHMDGTAMPGERGLGVISGHRDTHFEFLQKVEAGQAIVLTDAAGAAHRYRVTGTHIVDAKRVGLETEGETPRLALVTCYPFDAVSPGGPLRYVVFAEAETSDLKTALAASPDTARPR
jgi:sortase A